MTCLHVNWHSFIDESTNKYATACEKCNNKKEMSLKWNLWPIRYMTINWQNYELYMICGQEVSIWYDYKRKTWKGKIIKNILKWRKENDTYLTHICSSDVYRHESGRFCSLSFILKSTILCNSFTFGYLVAVPLSQIVYLCIFLI